MNDDWVDEVILAEKKFWDEEYPKMSNRRKIKHWTASIHRSMRTNAVYNEDEYATYTPQWFEQVLQIEPNFEKLLPKILVQVGDIADPITFYQKIGQPLPRTFKS